MSFSFDSLEKGKYSFISLGYSCSVAMDLGSMGLREESYPFDWIISSFSGVIECINNDFLDFLSDEYLFQSKKEPWRYLNTKYHFWFQHDFDEKKSFDSQIQIIKEKYIRRSERLTQKMKHKCVFFRYIHNQEDVNYICENKRYINKVLDIDGKNRIIIYLAGKKGIDYKNIEPIFFSKSGKGNSVGKHPIISNVFLNRELINLSALDKTILRKNSRHYHKNKIKPSKKFLLAIKRKVELLFNNYYHHCNMID